MVWLFFWGPHKAHESWFTFGLFHALFGIGLVSNGTAAPNEVMEQDVDARMRRTAIRPLPVGRKSVFHATTIGLLAALGGSLYLAALLSLMGMTGRLYPMGTVFSVLRFSTSAFVWLSSVCHYQRQSQRCARGMSCRRQSSIAPSLCLDDGQLHQSLKLVRDDFGVSGADRSSVSGADSDLAIPGDRAFLSWTPAGRLMAFVGV
jgi:hypothetical protein